MKPKFGGLLFLGDKVAGSGSSAPLHTLTLNYRGAQPHAKEKISVWWHATQRQGKSPPSRPVSTQNRVFGIPSFKSPGCLSYVCYKVCELMPVVLVFGSPGHHQMRDTIPSRKD